MKRTVYPVTDEILKELKEDVKKSGLKVNIRRHPQKYACGGIQITPKPMKFTDNELLILSDLLVNKYHMESLANTGSKTLSESVGKVDKLQLFYSSYISFLNPVSDLLN